MSLTALNSGQHIIELSSSMASDATRQINQPTSTNLPAQNRSEALTPPASNPAAAKPLEPDKIHALTQLNNAEQYSKIGTNVIQREQEMIGTLLDVHI